jgi:hypothetical protein
VAQVSQLSGVGGEHLAQVIFSPPFSYSENEYETAFKRRPAVPEPGTTGFFIVFMSLVVWGLARKWKTAKNKA